MTTPLRVFIGWDSRFHEPARVLAKSVRDRSSVPVDIRFLDARHLLECHGFRRVPDPRATTEFSFTRFLVPHLCGYSGTAVFMDNDMLCFGDVAELARTGELLQKAEQALAVVHHDYAPASDTKMNGVAQSNYPRKLWSSLMVMNCDRLGCWTPEVVATAPGSRLHRFQDVPDDRLMPLAPGWNEVKRLTPKTKLFHWTEGCVWNHPFWRKDLTELAAKYKYGDIWVAAYREWLKTEEKTDAEVRAHTDLRGG